MTNTNEQYDAAIKGCKDIFMKKGRDYGSSWRILRSISIVDQIYIKAKRIRTIQEKGHQEVADDILSEFRGIINYGVIGLIQLEMDDDAIDELSVDAASKLYDKQVATTKELMKSKNHDYGEAWRDMSQEGLTDLILQKLYRMKQIIRHDGQMLISEGLDANYMDIINYAVFAIILDTERLTLNA